MTRATRTALILFVLLAATAALAGAIALSGGTRKARDARNCFADTPPAAVTAVLIDQSDRFTTIDQKRVELVKRAVLQGVDAQTLVLIAVLTDSQVEPVRWIGGLCIDPKPKAGVLAYLTGNPKVQRAQWRRRSDLPLSKLLDETSQAALAEKRSYIGQALFAMSRRAEFSGAVRKRLVVFSDMLELSDTFSVYRGNPGQIEARLRAKPEWKGALNGFSVTVLRAYRPGQTRLNELADAYWLAYARASGSDPWTWL